MRRAFRGLNLMSLEKSGMILASSRGVLVFDLSRMSIAKYESGSFVGNSPSWITTDGLHFPQARYGQLLV